MDKVAKAILNSMKCPICGNQIDQLEWTVSKKGFNFGCVNDATHYSIHFIHWELPIRIVSENVMIYDGIHLYDIMQHHYLETMALVPFTKTQIIIREVDKEGRIIEGGNFTSFIYEKILFEFGKTDQNRILHRIKTILVFQ